MPSIPKTRFKFKLANQKNWQVTKRGSLEAERTLLRVFSFHQIRRYELRLQNKKEKYQTLLNFLAHILGLLFKVNQAL
jgi:hypothetical protein